MWKNDFLRNLCGIAALLRPSTSSVRAVKGGKLGARCKASISRIVKTKGDLEDPGMVALHALQGYAY